jgi:ElaB/YqjD/DUF883 family membrane-anchored ribosome-binding protein
MINERVLDDLQSLVGELEGLMKSAAGAVGDRADGAVEQVSAGLEQAKKRVHRLQDELKYQARQSARKADSYVRDNAWASLAAAAVVGALVGAVLARRR